MSAPLESIEADCFLDGFKKLKKVAGAVRKLDNLMRKVAMHPEVGTGHPKPLSGYGERRVWSRHITHRHRLIYEIREDSVVFIACHGHYDDR
ncbi:MAG: type II toxin-antitoxin system YoeB family toxin [Puniceicoccales bacterium]|jgi:toxin YoeB|nr:type II toxin-antitoxin system YoeB family toxin [Puniceicoccales bacterium]